MNRLHMVPGRLIASLFKKGARHVIVNLKLDMRGHVFLQSAQALFQIDKCPVRISLFEKQPAKTIQNPGIPLDGKRFGEMVMGLAHVALSHQAERQLVVAESGFFQRKRPPVAFLSGGDIAKPHERVTHVGQCGFVDPPQQNHTIDTGHGLPVPFETVQDKCFVIVSACISGMKRDGLVIGLKGFRVGFGIGEDVAEVEVDIRGFGRGLNRL